MKLVAFNGFRSDIDRFSTSNEIAQWSRRFFLLPAACSRVSSKRAMERIHSPLPSSFPFFLQVDSFMFAFCLAESPSHSSREKSRQKIFLRNELHTTKRGRTEGSAKRKSFLSFVVFWEIEQRNFIRKGRRRHTNAVCKVSWCGKELGPLETRLLCSAGERVRDEECGSTKKGELTSLYMVVGRKVDRRWLICHCWLWK